jgi:hypothetical protein
MNKSLNFFDLIALCGPFFIDGFEQFLSFLRVLIPFLVTF